MKSFKLAAVDYIDASSKLIASSIFSGDLSLR